MKKRDYRIKFLLLNTAILGGVAALVHMAYEVSEKITVIGLFAPVNESVWEHLKIMFFPNLIWWIVMYFVKKKSCAVVLRSWIFAAALSLLAAPLLVLLLFYAYTGAFGGPSIAVDIVRHLSATLALAFTVGNAQNSGACRLLSWRRSPRLIAFILSPFPPRPPPFQTPRPKPTDRQKLEKTRSGFLTVCANVHRLSRGKLRVDRVSTNNNAQRQLKYAGKSADIQNRISTVSLTKHSM